MLLLPRSRLRIWGISVKMYDKVKSVSFSEKKKGSEDKPEPKKQKEPEKSKEKQVKKAAVAKTGDVKKKPGEKREFFTEQDLEWKEPVSQFRVWFEEANQTDGILLANAMCLSTATKDGIPSGRFLLLKKYSMDGFKFFTNYDSRKAHDLEENPRASMSFYWDRLQRQVLINGTVVKIAPDESDKYFANRPREYRISSWASKQSTIIAGRQILLDKKKEIIDKYKKSDDIPRPDDWGGYILLPETVEFYQGQKDLLHDRILFRRLKPGEEPDGVKLHQGEQGWVYERLSP